MARARFVFISDGVDAGETVGGGGVDDRIWWRLVAGNNRVLGRCVGTDIGEQACRKRAAELAERIAETVPSLTTDERGRWIWTLALDAVDRAQCAHPFSRRVDCQRTLALFVDGVRSADPLAGAVRYFVTRTASVTS